MTLNCNSQKFWLQRNLKSVDLVPFFLFLEKLLFRMDKYSWVRESCYIKVFQRNRTIRRYAHIRRKKWGGFIIRTELVWFWRCKSPTLLHSGGFISSIPFLIFNWCLFSKTKPSLALLIIFWWFLPHSQSRKKKNVFFILVNLLWHNLQV